MLDQDKKRIYTFRKNLKLKIFLILIATIFLSSCGLSDWAYTKTPNDYEVWHLSSGDIKLIHDDGKIVIEKFDDNTAYKNEPYKLNENQYTQIIEKFTKQT